MKNLAKISIFILLISAITVTSITFIQSYYSRGNQNYAQSDQKHGPDVFIPILLYHDFVEKVPDWDPYDYAYMNTVEHLEENLRFLLDRGYTPISFTELYDAVQNNAPLPDQPIIITFDDGYIGQYTLAYPVLKKLDVKSAIFVTTELVGAEIDGTAYFDWPQALEMKNSGLVEICSHNSKHTFLNRIPAEDVREQVSESFDIIEKELGGSPLKVFSYPYGAVSKQTVSSLRNDGVQIQVYDKGINRLNTLGLSYVKRFNIPYSMTGREILELIESE